MKWLLVSAKQGLERVEANARERVAAKRGAPELLERLGSLLTALPALLALLADLIAAWSSDDDDDEDTPQEQSPPRR